LYCIVLYCIVVYEYIDSDKNMIRTYYLLLITI
jgi:hypothetical protein